MNGELIYATHIIPNVYIILNIDQVHFLTQVK